MLAVMAAADLAHWQLVSSASMMLSVQFVCLYQAVCPVVCLVKMLAEHDIHGSTACLQS